MDILPLIKNTGIDYHRLRLPFSTMGVDIESAAKKPLGELLKEAKVVIFNRYAGFDIYHLLAAKKKYGFKIIVDIDDYWVLYPNHHKAEEWKQKNMKQKILESLMNSDFVWASTARLAKEVSKINKKVEVLPNGLPFDTGQFAPSDSPSKSDIFRILYAGGSSHYWDLLSIKTSFQKISEDRDLKGRYEFILGGYSESELWNRIRRVFTQYGKLAFRSENVLPFDSYMSLYDDADLSIAPLEENYFNTFKSNLKVLEAGAKNLPIITSDLPPYSDEATDVFPRAASTKEWYTAIKYFIDNPEYAKQIGYKTGEYVRKHYNLFEINKIREQIINSLC